MTELETANAALRTAVETRLRATAEDSSDVANPRQLGGSAEASETYAEWSPPDYARREEAVRGFARVVEEARPAREARAGLTAKFGTGAVRSDAVEEFRYDLVSPIGLREVARACAEGAAKYSDFNWERGMPVHDLLNHAIAHVYAFLGGDRSEQHLGHAAWNLLSAIHSHELWPHLNDGHLRHDWCRAPTE